MCGITGFINYSSTQDQTLLEKALKKIHHRGPDDQGVFIKDTFMMGMRRLSIIDVAHGQQPISNEDETVTVVFNGEIYNHLELREELLKAGHVFKTQSDTESLVHGYEEWGSDLPKRLRGMFAFCIHDAKKNVLFIARDQFGIKPLYYRLDGGKVASFGSEIKSLLVDTSYAKDEESRKNMIVMDTVFAYATFQYNPEHETMFKHIFKLSPGHSLTIDLKNESYSFQKYWQFTFADSRNQIKTDDKAAYSAKKDEIRKIITDSVKHHMIADVPVASFLSSGVDSSIVAGLAHAHIKEGNAEAKLKTYTIGFPDNRSETIDAGEHAVFMGTEHKEIEIGFNDYFSVLKRCVWHFDEPIADPSAISLYLMSREVAKDVKVVLSGEGADELFGGYGIYKEPRSIYIRLLSEQPEWFKSFFLKPMVAIVNSIVWVAPVLRHVPGVSFLNRAITPIRSRYIGNAHIFTEEEKVNLFKNYTKRDTTRLLDLGEMDVSKLSESEYMQFVDIHNWMRGDILAKADKMTMANSLELRVPFLDIEVSGVATTIPDSWKYVGDSTKAILRDAFTDIMPKATNERPKLGFPTPWHMWLQKDHAVVKHTLLESEFLKDICHTPEIEKLFTPFALQDKFVGRRIFVLLMLALWYDVYIKDESYEA